ncbi:plastid transcriptionally active [Thalictrum thalictroides]|uniref:Plastid transcriptionally active n=1 Tax=Thalictrum thalictroides TaxID=46969 RepID=A0A7J6UZX9_THATH|nr:plastid transcriptionally active [Thalictrum thalictroides]
MSQTVGALSFCSSLHPPAFTRNEAAAKSKVRQVKSNLIYSRWEKPMEELYNIKVERGLTAKRLDELGVSRWSMWKTGKCQLSWDWQVDQLVYIVEGEVRVVPEGSERYMRFVAGDLVRYPKWFEADLYFNAPYQELYSFRAYGDD